MKNYKSNSGKNYQIKGDLQSGYRAKDLDNDQNAAYSTDSFTEMKNHIEDVESGKQQEAGSFGK